MIEKNIKRILMLMFIISILIVGGKIANGKSKEELQVQTIDVVEDDVHKIVQQVDNTSQIIIEMLTNLTSHRADGIPSIKSEQYLTVQFNVTNMNTSALHSLELTPSTNDFGILLNNTSSYCDILEGSSSWLSEEYTVKAIQNESSSLGALDLVIVLDQSGSMDDEITSLTNNLIKVVNELHEQVPDLRIGLILFGGSEKNNPYIYEELITPLTSDIKNIVDVLETTKAEGSNEPWGDALWVAQHWMDWRENIPNLIVLITDEPGDEGVKVSPSNLDALYRSIKEDGIILCTIAASGSDSITISRLKNGAEITGGTYIQIGSEEYPQTEDLPDIIGELIVTYAVEKNLKVIANISYLTEPGDETTKQTMEVVFSVILDDLAPEIRTWTYFTENFIEDKKYVNIMVEVLDLTGVPFVEIYYKFNGDDIWITSRATNQSSNTYLLSLEYTYKDDTLDYYIYTQDYLGNSNITDIVTVELKEELEYSSLESGRRQLVSLGANQSTNLLLIGNTTSDSFGIFRLDYKGVYFYITAYDVNSSEILAESLKTNLVSITIPKNHVVQVQIWSPYSIDLQIYNVIPREMQFKESFEHYLTYKNAILVKLDNRLNETKTRSIMADSEYIYTELIVFNASNWEEIAVGGTEIELPAEECYVLIYCTYHEGSVNISFNFEVDNVPYEHFDGATEAVQWEIWFVCLALLVVLGPLRTKRKKLLLR
ncbi:MAG: vWA domain-containing protein [Candidatus Heimdallarchaeaceae archaeon]